MIYNAILNAAFGTALHDANCGLKMATSQCAKLLPLQGDLHRFAVVFASLQGCRITEVPVSHRNRKAGRSKYGWRRFEVVFWDFIYVYFLHVGFRRLARVVTIPALSAAAAAGMLAVRGIFYHQQSASTNTLLLAISCLLAVSLTFEMALLRGVTDLMRGEQPAPRSPVRICKFSSAEVLESERLSPHSGLTQEGGD